MTPSGGWMLRSLTWGPGIFHENLICKQSKLLVRFGNAKSTYFTTMCPGLKFQTWHTYDKFSLCWWFALNAWFRWLCVELQFFFLLNNQDENHRWCRSPFLVQWFIYSSFFCRLKVCRPETHLKGILEVFFIWNDLVDAVPRQVGLK